MNDNNDDNNYNHDNDNNNDSNHDIDNNHDNNYDNCDNDNDDIRDQTIMIFHIMHFKRPFICEKPEFLVFAHIREL